MDNDIKLLTDYIAAWSYQIISIVLLVSSIIMILIGLPKMSFIIAGTVFVVFIIIQYVAIKRRKEIFADE